jgi:acetyl-CoA carboxylase biotin carboxyl carrier protein
MARQPDDKPAAKFQSEDSALIRELALLLDETSLTEIEIERAGLRVRVARNVSIAATMPANYQPTASASATASVAVADLAKHPGVVPSPMVGTAYWASEPGAKPFIEVGRTDAADHRGHEDDEPDSITARGHRDADSCRGRPAGRIRRTTGNN